MRVVAWAASTAGALVLAASTSATPPLPAQKQALAAVKKAVASGRLDAPIAAAARGEIARATHLVRALPPSRSAPVNVALAQLGALAGKLTQPRALAVIGQLKANDDYFSRHYPPAPKTDVADDDGLVYRWFPGKCLEFHPLAEFGALNAAVASGDTDATKRLADALIARGVYQPGGGIAWEYDFDYAGGHAPWLSGMAQAVAAQAFARAAELVDDESPALIREATAAYHAIPGRLLTKVAAGPWIKLYGFNSVPVLNAQLQAVISLESYATAAEDAEAGALATRMQQAAAATLPRFDTGFWTLYSLAGDASPLDYSKFVIQLLAKLAKADPRFADAQTRFAGYLKQPPAFQVANAGLGQVRFWLSKPSTVHVVTGAGPAKLVGLGAGWHTLAWTEPKRAGAYGVSVDARDWAGNGASFQALPIVRATAAGSAGKPPHALAAAAAMQPSFVVGAGLDDPAQAPLAQKVGLRAVRVGVAWPAGAAAADPGVIAALQRVPSTQTLIVELAANPMPADDAGRTALAMYAASLAQQVPVLHELVLTPAPSAAVAPSYAAALAAVRAAVQAAVPGVAVGAAVDGSAAPKAAVAALGRALAGSPVDIVAFRPAPTPATGAWTAANLPQLQTSLVQAFGGTAPPVLEDGVAAATPAQYASLIAGAACSPALSGIVIDRLVDSATTPATTTGLFAVDGSAKAGVNAVTAATAAAQRGLQVCPGVAAPATASTLEFPTALAAGSPTTVRVGCVRDCLYLVTLDGPDGKPIVASRGALRGGMAPAVVSLPKAPLKAGSYRVDVRLVSQVNPGEVTQQLSPPLSVG